MSTNSYLYQNITISGLPGNGSTTLLNTLREALKEEGWKGFSGGEFMRNYALEKGLFDGAKRFITMPLSMVMTLIAKLI